MRRSRGAAGPRPSRSRRARPSSPRAASTSTRSSGHRTARRLAVMAQRGPNVEETSQIAFVDVATGDTRVVAGERSVDVGGSLGSRRFAALRLGCRWLVPGRSPDRRRARPDRPDQRRARAWRSVRRGRVGAAARRPMGRASSTSRSTTACRTWSSATSPAAEAPRRGRGRPPKTPRTVTAATAGSRINPWDGVWKSVGWLADGAWIAATGERETGPADLWLLPVPGVAAGRRATAPGHRLAAGRPARRALAVARAAPPSASSSRPATGSGSRARSGARTPRPASAAGPACRRSSTRTAARPASPSARSSRSSSCWSRRASPSSTSTSAGRPATAGPSASPTTTSGATPTSTISSTPRAGPPSSPGRTAGWRSMAARTAATWCCARSSTSRRCGGPASTCTATPRSPRAIATATVSAGWTSTR